MISSILKTGLMSVGLAFIAQVVFACIDSQYVYGFLKTNLINIQIALLAINAATLGIVLTKIRDLVDRGLPLCAFNSTKKEMLLSIKEQIGLIAVALIVFSTQDAKSLPIAIPKMLVETLALACFFYSLAVLYDTAKSVFVILDFEERP